MRRLNFDIFDKSRKKVISLNRTYDNELHVTHLATFLCCQLNAINIVFRRQVLAFVGRSVKDRGQTAW